MAGILSGTMRAPLTAVVFAFELPHDVNAFLPTILGWAVAYGFSVIVMPRSILPEKIARRGRHVYREYGVDPLERHFVEEVMSRDPITIPATLPAVEALKMYFGEGQRHRAYPVVDNGRVLGMIDRADFSAIPADGSNLPVAQLLCRESTAAFILPSDTCRAVALRLAAGALERLPVVSDPVTRHRVGIVSRSDLVKPARALHEEEEHREGPLKFGSED